MCDVLRRLESSGVYRRNILASFGLGAAVVTLAARAETIQGAHQPPGPSNRHRLRGTAPAWFFSAPRGQGYDGQLIIGQDLDVIGVGSVQ